MSKASRSSASPAPSPPGDFPLPAPVFANFAADLPLGVSLSPPAIFTVLSVIMVFEDLSFGRRKDLLLRSRLFKICEKFFIQSQNSVHDIQLHVLVNINKQQN
ncbi:hypothetical protein GQX74_001339 [Glossina fuscipes]|nr:hypothetical protein GQX74_001339 [Glossina fuscipes]